MRNSLQVDVSKATRVISTIAIIPARGGSKRIPRKNIALLGGKPMIAYPIAACCSAGIFDEVIVSTEDRRIAEIARLHGATVDTRPQELAEDRVPASAACAELLHRRFADKMIPDWFCLVYPIAAFIEAEDLVASFQRRYDAHGVMGVSGYRMHPYKAMVERDGFMTPLWPEENARQSQTYPETFASNGTFCWMRTEVFLASPGFYPERLKSHVLPPDRAVDIDKPADLDYARKLMEFRIFRGSAK